MRRIFLFIAVFAVLLAMPGLVSAHAKLVSSTPENGATLDVAPATMTLKFDSELASDGATLVVTDTTGAVVDNGDGAVDLSDTERKTMTVSLKSGLGAGDYTATWTVIGDDGHEITGSIVFAVGAASVPSAPVSAAPTPAADHAPNAVLPATGGASTPLWMGALALICVAAGVMLRRNGRPI